MRDKAKQEKYLKERIKNKKSIRKAAKAAGINERTAFRAEKDPKIKSAMAAALERVGCTDEKIATTVLEALDATKVISANIISQPGDGMTDAHGTTKDFIDVPDFQARIKAAELAGKFRGDFIEKHELSGSVAHAIEIVDYSSMVGKKSGANRK